MEVYFIRHTTPLIEKDICYGQTDLDLADSFTTEKEAVVSTLTASFDAVYSSPLKRCFNLATELTAEPVLLDDRLKEIHFGDWEMQPWDNIPKADLDVWMKDFVNISPPNGESMLELEHRVMEWWDEIKNLSFKRIGVVTHGGVIRILNASFNNIPLNKSFNKFKIDYGGILKFNI